MQDNPFILSCCSTADLSQEHFLSRDIHHINFRFALGGHWYEDDLGQSIPLDEFYKRMEQGETTQTSQVNPAEYLNYFESFLKEGKDVLHLALSSGISGSYSSALHAKEELSTKYPDRKLYVIDSLAASSGYGLLMDQLADLRDEGQTIDQVVEYALAHRLELNHWFFSTDLKYYVRGGRISKTSGFVGNMLHICPLLNVNNEGRLIPRTKHRGTAHVIKEIVNRMAENAQNGLDYSGKCYISHANCLAMAQAVAKDVEARFPKLSGPVEIYSIGTTIGSHTGPGTVALFFWGNKRGA